MGKNQHVVPAGDGWGVRGAGNGKLTAKTETQAQAIAIARPISQRQGSELLIHGRDGQIRDKDSHGRDGFPPRG